MSPQRGLREPVETRKPGAVRCAIYTRKSTEEGLEQEFNSLDAQREATEAFIQSQRHEGWVCLPGRYDDGGFSGGSMGQPAKGEVGRRDAGSGLRPGPAGRPNRREPGRGGAGPGDLRALP